MELVLPLQRNFRIQLKKWGNADKIIAVEADSPATNTGHKNGAIHQLKCCLGRPLQRIICSLHLNELLLCHLCNELLNPTESATQWNGPIGKALATYKSLPLSSACIQCIAEGQHLTDIGLYVLSRDQAYLHKMLKAVRTGVTDEDLREKPRSVSHTSWLTTANRICQLYVAKAQPSEKLCPHRVSCATINPCGSASSAIQSAQMARNIYWKSGYCNYYHQPVRLLHNM